MRLLLLTGALMFSCLSLVAQDCELTKDEVDPFDGIVKRATKNYKIGKHVPGDAVYSDAFNTISVRATRSDTLCALFVTPAVRKGCTNNTSYVQFKFEDGSMLKLHNVGDVDCSSNTLSIIVRQPDFQGRRVALIRASYTNGTLDYDIVDGGRIEQLLQCLLD